MAGSVDVEQEGVLEHAGLKLVWDSIFALSGSVALFLDALLQQGRTIVIDWGFPPPYLPIITALQRHGVEAWWLDGNRKAARQSFIQRGTVPVQCFDRQMRAIRQEWSNIKAVFAPHTISTVKRGPTYMPPEDVSKLIRESSVI